MKTLLRIIQFVWLLPATILVWLFYILPMWLIFRDLVFVSWAELFVAEFRLADKDLEPWYAKAWRDWYGWGGPCVFIRRDDSTNLEKTRIHELRHCEQQFIWGVFFYPAYFFDSVLIWLFAKNLHAYLDNWFERDARKTAGQIVDIPREMWPQGEEDHWPWW